MHPRFRRKPRLHLWLESLEPRALLAGTGLSAVYFDNADLTTQKLTRADATVDFNWGSGTPDASVGADTFSARWTGQVEALYSELYTFSVTSDDGFRLWVDDTLIAGDWTNHSTREISGTIALRAGQRYDIKLEYYDNTGNALVQLRWASPSQARQIIPASQLYPTSPGDDRGSMVSEYWTGISGSAISALTSDANYPAKPSGREYLLNFESIRSDWADSYGRRLRGFLHPLVSGNYTLAIAGDDEAQLFLSTDATEANKQLVATASNTAFRDFSAQPAQRSSPIALVAGQKYYVEVLHKAGTGGDHVSVGWQVPGGSSIAVIGSGFISPFGTETALPAQGSILATLARGRPRLLSTPERFEWVKQQIALPGQMQNWFNSLKSSADGYLDDALPVYNPDNRGTILGIARSVVDHVYKLAMMYRLTGGTQYAERAWAELNAAAAFPDWHPAHFLDTAEMTHGFAIGYDWLYDYWTPAQRTTLRTAMVTKGLNPGLTVLRAGNSWAGSGSNNWNAVCNGGLTMGALAIAEEEPAIAEELLAKSIPSAKAVMRHFASDAGAWYEGPGYWGYTTEYLNVMIAGLEQALGSDFGMARIDGFNKAGDFAVGNVGPTNLSYNFADGGAGKMSGPRMLYYARRFNRPELAWQVRNDNSAAVLSLLWYDTRGGEVAADATRTDYQWRGDQGAYATQDIVNLRTEFHDTEASFASFKAGKVGDAHGNMDTGSFVFDALGTRWAHDLGGDDYALPGYFSEPQRWTYYRMRAEGHNTLVINPGSGADQVDGSSPKMLRFEASAARSYGVTDMTAAYTGVTRAWRGIMLDKSDGSLLVQDEIEATASADVWWFMHVKLDASQVQISADGSAALLTSGTDRLWIKIVSGGGAQFELRDPVPLPTSPNPTGQNANAGFKKLAIHLPQVLSRTLAVWLVPLPPAKAIPGALPTISPLINWTAPAPAQVHIGDIDDYARSASDDPPVDAAWLSSITSATGLSAVGFDQMTSGQVVPFTFNFIVPAGQMVTGARLALGLKSGGGDASNDVLYLDSTSPIAFSAVGLGNLTTTPAGRTLDLRDYLMSLQDGRLNVAFASDTAIDWASLALDFAPTGQFTALSSLTPIADAYVRGGTYATQNFGTSSTLVTKAETGDYARESFLRFDLASITQGVSSAWLKVHVVSQGAPVEGRVALVGDDSWGETTINYNNRPTAAAGFIGFDAQTGRDAWIDITSLVQGELAGDKTLSLRLAGAIAGADFHCTYSSREASTAAFRPELLITTFDATAPAQMSIAGGSGADVLRVVRDGMYLSIYRNNASTPEIRRDWPSLNQLTIDTAAGADTLTLDLSGGAIVPGGGLVARTGADIDVLRVVGTTGNDVVTVNSAGITINGQLLPPNGAELHAFDLATGADVLNINGVTVTLAGDAAISSSTDVNIDGNGTLDLNGTTAIDALTLTSGNVINGMLTPTSVTASAGTISAAIAGSTGLTKKGAGTLILSGASTYTGTTRLEQGILNVRHAQALGAPGGLVQFALDANAGRLGAIELEGVDFTLDGKPLQVSGAGISGAGAIRNLSGNHTWAGSVSLTSGAGGTTLQSDSGLLTFTGDISATTTGRTFTLQGAGGGRIEGSIANGSTAALPLTKSGTGTWTLAGANDSYTGTTTINAGTLVLESTHLLAGAMTINASATVRLGDAKLLQVPTLTINTTSGRLDLTTGQLIVDYTGASPLSTIQSHVLRGYANGAWTGAGILSSAIGSSTPRKAIGYGDASALGLSTFAGRALDGTAVVVRFTYAGDADLSGAIDADDYFRTDAGFLAGRSGWIDGNFNYDTRVNIDDYFLIDTSFALGGDPLAVSPPQPLDLFEAPLEDRRLDVLAQ